LLNEEYAAWLIDVYTQESRRRDPTPDLAQQTMAVIRRHSRRWPGEEDFVSLVTLEMVERLKKEKDQAPPFLTMVEQAADTVRHRITRAAQRQIQPSPEATANLRAPSSEDIDLVATEIAAELSLEEQTVLSLVLDGVAINEIADRLKVSLRTVYRRLEGIRDRIEARKKSTG
jgi:DNA-binding CsgD family transcriptional regulator